MFGLYRTILAIWVMIFHLVYIPVIGPYAVFSFFVLSGFLMTTIMKEVYGYSVGGIIRYAVNRMLRLYPVYWAAIMFSLVVVALVGQEYATDYKNILYVPGNLVEILANITMIFPGVFPNEFSPRLSPPTWALTLELFFYFTIALGISRTKALTILWLTLSAVLYAWSYLEELHPGYRYGTLMGASLPFAVGASLYYYKGAILSLLRRMRIQSPLILGLLFIAHAGFFTLADYYSLIDFLELGKYTNIVLSAALTVSLFYRGKDFFSKKLDGFLGDFSYPIYLLHWQGGLLASWLLFTEPTRGLTMDGALAFILALSITLAVSMLFTKTIDQQISKFRARIRSSSPSANTINRRKMTTTEPPPP